MTKRVLIVDDEPIVVALLWDCFASFQQGRAYEITSAHSVSEGFALLQRERFDLILLDMVIPEPDCSSPGKQGLDLLKRVRAHGVNAPVLMMTGGSDSGTEADASGSGLLVARNRPAGPLLQAGSGSLHHGPGADRRPALAPRCAELLSRCDASGRAQDPRRLDQPEGRGADRGRPAGSRVSDVDGAG